MCCLRNFEDIRVLVVRINELLPVEVDDRQRRFNSLKKWSNATRWRHAANYTNSMKLLIDKSVIRVILCDYRYRLRRVSSIVSDVRGGLLKPKMKNPTLRNDRVIYDTINRKLDKIRMYIPSSSQNFGITVPVDV